MKNPHEQQAAAMDRAGELPDGEQLRECINSGQVSAAQVVAHAEAGELPPLPPEDVIDIHTPTGVRIYGYTAAQMHAHATAALAAERAEVARYRADAERFAWWFDDSDDKSGFIDKYLEGLTEKWGLENWRKAIDGAMAEQAAITAPGEKHD